MALRKLKVSLTLSTDLVELVDENARRSGTTRSGLAERWLRVGASRAADRAVEEATTAYYASIQTEASDEALAIARASSAAARRVRYDERLRRKPRRARR